MNCGFLYYVCLMLIPMGILTSACTEKIDIELDSTYARLVVDGKVTTDSVKHVVMLSITSDYFSNMPAPAVQGALVELSFDDEIVQLVEDTEQPGLYETPYAFRGHIGTTYSLDISLVDVDQDGTEEHYHASGTMMGGSELLYIELKYYPSPFVSGYTVFMHASHPREVSDWFGFKLRKNSDLLTDSLHKYRVLSDELFDTGYFPGFPIGFLSDDDPRQAIRSGDTVSLEMNCIEEVYYDFVNEAQLEIAGYYPLFSGPPSNIVSNIDNGAMGIFAVYSIQRYSLIVE